MTKFPFELSIERVSAKEQTETLLWEPLFEGVFPFYCTDFCSALHQEMQGYVRVSPKDSNTELKWSLGL